MPEALDNLDSSVADALESLSEEVMAESVSVPYLDEDVALAEDVEYEYDGRYVVARYKFGGISGVYEDLTTSEWSPVSIVYELAEEFGFDTPTNNPKYGVQIFKGDETVYMEVPVEADN